LRNAMLNEFLAWVVRRPTMAYRKSHGPAYQSWRSIGVGVVTMIEIERFVGAKETSKWRFSLNSWTWINAEGGGGSE
jgi:hypothetical protein